MNQAGQMTVSDVSGFFKKSPFEDLDKVFWIALAAAIFVEALIVFVMASRPADIYSEKEIARIQERFANFILEAEDEVETAASAGAGEGAGEEADDESGGGESEVDLTEEAPETAGEVEDAPESGDGRRQSRGSTQEAVRQSRARIEQEVQGKGLLGLLTGTGSAATGEGVSSIFSTSRSSSGSGDLDEILGNVSGLKTQGQSGLGTPGGSGLGAARGGRSGESATIDDLVSSREGMASESLTRKGDLHLDTPTGFQGGGSRSAGRNPNVIHEVLLGHVNAVQYCYERELKRDPGLKGKITVRITVGPDGGVTNVEIVNSTLNNSRVERCIVSRIRLWKDFPPIDPSEGNVAFRQTYTFGY